MVKITHNPKFKFTDFVITNSSLVNCTLVTVTYFYQGQELQRNIPVKNKSNNESYYINQAVRTINRELKSGYLEKYSIEYLNKVVRRKRLLLILACTCTIITIGLIALLIWLAIRG